MIRYAKEKFGDEAEMDKAALAASVKAGRYRVLCHGDSYFNNMLFRKEPSSGAVSAALFDLSMAKWATPANDLAYFFFLSTSPDFRTDNLDDLLRFYHDRFTEALGKLGCRDPEEYTLRSALNVDERGRCCCCCSCL